MSDNAGALEVEISGKDVNLTTLLNRIEQQLQKAEQTGQRTGKAIGEGVGNGTQRGASGALAMQQAVARLEVAQGNAAGAADRLRNALAQQDATTIQTVNAQRQLISVENQLQQSQSGAAATIEAFKNGLVSFAAPAAVAGAAIGAIKGTLQSFADAFDFKAKLDQSTASIKVQLQGVRDSNEVFQGASRFANQYKLTQEETTNAIQSSIPVIRNSKASIEDILGVFARLRVLKPEKTFDDAARALGELQAGQVQSIVQQFNLSRTAANKMKAEIEGGADAVQVLSKYLTESGTTMDSLAVQTGGVTGKMRELAQAQEELKLAQADWAQGPGLTILQGKIQVMTGLTRVLNGDFANMGRAANQAAQEGSFGFQLFNAATGGAISTLARYQAQQDAAAASIRQGTDVTRQHAQMTLVAADAEDRAAQASTTLSGALADELSKKIDSQQETANLAQLQSQLEADSRLAAQGLLGAGDQALILANKYGIAAQQAQFLIQQQQRLSNAQALADQRAGERNPGSSGQAEAAAEEDRRLKALYRTLEDPPKKPKKERAGGGVKLSDQQKLNNSLLADQEKFDDKYEDLELTHAQDLLKIQQDFQEKMRSAQRDFDQDQLDGRAGFYDNLGNIESDKLRKMASEQYEQAAQEAQKIAAEKGADVADKYMQAQEQIISARTKRLADIEKAEKDKDAGKAEYLKGVDEAYRKAEDAKLARIREGEGSLSAERDKQIQDANQKYEESEGKIATAAERAADRKIAAAERAGKKIDEEQARADKLAATYDKIAPSGGSAAAPSTSTSSSASTSASSSGAAGPLDPSKILEKLDELRSAIVAATDKAADKVASAVQSSGGLA